jgi:nucleoside 2-deoxyribosyltransferase
MKIIYAQSPIEIQGKSVFLAGPTPRSKDVKGWRKDFVNIFKDEGFEGTLLLPEFEDLKDFTVNFAYNKQIEWEHEAMERADIILFWIPRTLPDMPAFTTNTEFGYWIAKNPSKIKLGIPDFAVKCDYIKYMANKENIKINTESTTLISNVLKNC